jgi:cytochrome d ubiquinol oxidase subunit II
MDHAVLQVIWFILWGVLWAVYFMLDGFDLGIGTILPFFAKTDEEKRVLYNAQGPFWDGNEVWLITAGGATFAAFPKTYAVMFSGLYTPLLIILFALIVRGVSYEFRGKVESPGWRSIWDFTMFIGSAVPALLFGVAFANIFMGLPLDQNGVFQGNLFTLLNPYGLLGGLLFLVMFIQHGALWLTVKTEGSVQEKAANLANKVWVVELILAALFLVASFIYTDLWNNYFSAPVFFIVPLLAVVGLILMKVYISKAAWLKAWISSALTIVMATAYGVIGLFPRMLPSSINPEYSLTIYNSSSSYLTLVVMTIVALIFVPIVIGYQFWVYRLFSDKISADTISQNPEAY